MDRVLFGFGVLVVSENATDLSGHVSSTMNLVALSIESLCCKNCSL